MNFYNTGTSGDASVYWKSFIAPNFAVAGGQDLLQLLFEPLLPLFYFGAGSPLDLIFI